MLMLALALLADRPPIPVNTQSKPAAKSPAAPVSLYAAVAQRMSPAGRAIFERYITQTLTPRAQADAQADITYRNAVRQRMTSPTLDLDAVTKLIDQRKRAAADTATAIRTSAFAMIKSLPPQDRKLALTAIFTDTRLPKAS